MAATFITDEDAAGHLRLDLVTDANSPEVVIDDRLPDLHLKMIAAEAVVLDYLKVTGEDWTSETVPDVVRAAILLVLGALWEDRDGTEALGKLMDARTGTVALLLMRLRDPALA